VLAASTDTSVTLGWTAVGDDSLTGTATAYQVRWSTSTITAANWSAATLVTSGVPAPAAPGNPQSCTITGLSRASNLYFAVRAADEVNNWSALSNVVVAPGTLDASPPATPTGLVASAQAGGEHLHWNANSEADLAGYRIYRATDAAGPFTRLNSSLLTSPDYVDAVPDSLPVAWYAVSAVDASANESAHTATVRVQLRGANIRTVAIQAAYPNPSSLTSSVTLPVDVPASGPVDGRIDIVNSAGERVHSIELRGLAPGTNIVSWDGRNDSGRLTAPGVYRALLHVGGTDQVVRLVRKP
jgi:hypothetical protein